MQTFHYQNLQQFTEEVFLKMGCSPQDATQAAHVLITADLRGIDSHGVARLIGYVRLWEKKRINTKPNMHIVHESPSTAVIDADEALGLIAAPKAMEIAIQKAESAGTGWVAVRNSNHFGIAGYHAMMALPHNMIGQAMTNASPLVAPTFSAERLLGTNALALAIPAGSAPAFVADFATTTVANGKLEILQRKNEQAPVGWIQDQHGRPTQDPMALSQGGALLPLGSERERGSHKGYSLGAWVDIFSGVLSGANYGPWVPPFVSFLSPVDNLPGKGIGHFLGAMRIDAFRPADEFKQHMDQWIHRFRTSKPVAGQEEVLIPGDPEREMEAIRKEAGIPLLEPVVDDLQSLAERFKLVFLG